MAEKVDLTLLAKLARDNLREIKSTRRELADVRALTLQTADYVRKMEQRLDARISGLDGRISNLDGRISNLDGRISNLDDRIIGVRDDLELMVKSELMGSLGNFEVRIGNLLHERLAAIEKTD